MIVFKGLVKFAKLSKLYCYLESWTCLVVESTMNS